MKLLRTESGGKVLLIGRGGRVRVQGCLKGRKRLREKTKGDRSFHICSEMAMQN